MRYLISLVSGISSLHLESELARTSVLCKKKRMIWYPVSFTMKNKAVSEVHNKAFTYSFIATVTFAAFRQKLGMKFMGESKELW